MNKRYFPLFIDISKKKVIVIGGGKVAERRVKTLLEFVNHIEVVSPEVTRDLYGLSERREITWIKGCYTAGVLDGADMVLAATDNADCNEKIVRDCRERGILVNTAHKKEMCDFYFPAVAVSKNVVAGITASGMNHSQAGGVRKRIEDLLENIQDDERQRG